MIERAIEAKREQHRAHLAAQITARVTVQMAMHLAEQLATKDVAYEAHFRVLEGLACSDPKVTNVKAPHDIESPTYVIARFSVDSRSGNVISFCLSFINTIIFHVDHFNG
jgi:hypothetical protein